MYSYEDRIRAVKLYLKLGRQIAATRRQLGYPTKNSLLSWYREYQEREHTSFGLHASGRPVADEGVARERAMHNNSVGEGLRVDLFCKTPGILVKLFFALFAGSIYEIRKHSGRSAFGRLQAFNIFRNPCPQSSSGRGRRIR